MMVPGGPGEGGRGRVECWMRQSALPKLHHTCSLGFFCDEMMSQLFSMLYPHPHHHFTSYPDPKLALSQPSPFRKAQVHSEPDKCPKPSPSTSPHLDPHPHPYPHSNPHSHPHHHHHPQPHPHHQHHHHPLTDNTLPLQITKCCSRREMRLSRRMSEPPIKPAAPSPQRPWRGRSTLPFRWRR